MKKLFLFPVMIVLVAGLVLGGVLNRLQPARRVKSSTRYPASAQKISALSR